jgi:GST-like protein
MASGADKTMAVSKIHTLYGVPGWGSALAEAALTKAEVSFEFVDVDGFDRPGPARQKLLAINPLAQVPTLVLPNGEVLTESAAIMLHLSECFPLAGLAPPAGDVVRPAFLRRLVWLTAALYPTFTYADYPERWAPSAPDELKASIARHRQELWLQWEHEVEPAPWVLGPRFSALDIYVATMSRWAPRRTWLDEHCPKLMSAARAADALPDLRPVWRRNFGDEG